jgi:hypothetical protein
METPSSVKTPHARAVGPDAGSAPTAAAGARDGRSYILTRQAPHGLRLGGIRKTATAIEYAHRHAEDYACVLWAESESALTSGFAALAPHLGLPFLEKTDE